KDAQVDGEAETLLRVQHVEGGKQDAHEACLPGRRTRRLDQVVLELVGARTGEGPDGREEEITEEGADHRDARAEAELEHDEWGAAADDEGDEHRSGHGPQRELATPRRSRGSRLARRRRNLLNRAGLYVARVGHCAAECSRICRPWLVLSSAAS